MADLIDPLLVMLQRHEAAIAAFNAAVAAGRSEAERDALFDKDTATMHHIVDRKPRAGSATLWQPPLPDWIVRIGRRETGRSISSG